jgi:hypothetical protein
MRSQGVALGVVLVLGACSVINKFEEVAPEAQGGESNGGGAGGRGGNTNGGTSGDGGAPPEGGTSGTAGNGGEGDTGGTTGGTDTGGTSGTGGCTTMTTFYRDADEDTYGDDATTEDACEAPTGYVDRGGDCADDDDAKNPGATEICNGLDENCNDPDEGSTCPTGCVPRELNANMMQHPGLYLVCEGPVNWTTARMTCVDEGMILARVRSTADNAAIRAAMNTEHGTTEYWLGGTDGPTNAEEGTWRWLAGDIVFFPATALYANWAMDQPATQFPAQDCLKANDSQWFAEQCQLTFGFVCEFVP